MTETFYAAVIMPVWSRQIKVYVPIKTVMKRGALFGAIEMTAAQCDCIRSPVIAGFSKLVNSLNCSLTLSNKTCWYKRACCQRRWARNTGVANC